MGTTPDASKVQYQEYYAVKYHAPLLHTLQDTLEAALNMIGKDFCQVLAYLQEVEPRELMVKYLYLYIFGERFHFRIGTKI